MLAKPLRPSLSEILERLRVARSLWIATDFDGTLTPIVSHPGAARLPPQARRALSRLARLDRVEVAILSGRSLPDLRRRLRVRGVFLAGTAGLVTMAPGEAPVCHVPAARVLAPDLRAALRTWCARFPGAWLEDKGAALSLHYRGVALRHQKAFRSGARRLMRARRDRVILTEGKKVIEVAPAVPWNKGSALRAWRRRRGGLLFYFGDDANDEPAYSYARRQGGIAVAVGRARTRVGAQYRLASSQDVVWMLDWLARAWLGPRSGVPTR